MSGCHHCACFTEAKNKCCGCFAKSTSKTGTDWAKVLCSWRKDHDRIGLTMHALVAITGRSASTLMAEMDASAYVYAQHCEQEKALVYTWRTSPHSSKLLKEDPKYMNYYRPGVRRWLKLFPPPEYKSVKNFEGQTSIGMAASTVAALKALC